VKFARLCIDEGVDVVRLEVDDLLRFEQMDIAAGGHRNPHELTFGQDEWGDVIKRAQIFPPAGPAPSR